jgi:hypothetical protein
MTAATPTASDDSTPTRSNASGSRSATAVATTTPAASAMNACSRWRSRSAAIPPARVEKNGRIATSGMSGEW